MRLNKAFTLAETLIVFIIIGIIASLGVTTVKPWDKAYKYAYSRIYNSLTVTIYNYMSKKTGENAFPATSKDFCCAMLEYLNTSGPTVYPGVSQEPCPKNATTGAFNPPANHTCQKADLAKDPISFPINNSDIKLLKLSNGARMWFASYTGAIPVCNSSTGACTNVLKSKTYFTAPSSGTQKDSLDNKIEFKYYIVFVDLNGDKRPNSARWKNGSTILSPDIVAFAVTDQYIVLPLGYPIIDTKYLATHVIYPAVNDSDDGNSDDTEVVSDVMTFHEARARAFSYNTDSTRIISAGDLFTVDYESLIGLKNEDNGGFFRVKDLNSHYETVPSFDSDLCMLEETNSSGVKVQIKQPICDVKIFDYH